MKALGRALLDDAELRARDFERGTGLAQPEIEVGTELHGIGPADLDHRVDQDGTETVLQQDHEDGEAAGRGHKELSRNLQLEQDEHSDAEHEPAQGRDDQRRGEYEPRRFGFTIMQGLVSARLKNIKPAFIALEMPVSNSSDDVQAARLHALKST